MNMLLPGNCKPHIQYKISVLLVFLCLVNSLLSQEIRISCSDEPLNNILVTLRDNYGLMLSFDDEQLSAYTFTVDKKFASPPQAFDFLLRGLPLAYEVSGGVYVFYTVRVKEKPKNFVISGRLSDKTSHETLPYSGILINNTVVLSDAKGNFSFVSSTDSIFSMRISYLGYYMMDTTVTSGTHYNFTLTPSVIVLEEIVVEGSKVARSIETGTSPGISRMNHKIAYYLPGNGDNSIFNLLRLQPGILAAGEQSSDFIIWGSYEGQSQVLFDGFTIYGMKNFNDNISAVNPFMAKDIKVIKGAYGAEYGERVGGIVDITGTDGNRLSPSIRFCINNMTLNGTVSVPFRKRSALILAYRQTFYDLYQALGDSSMGFGRGNQSSSYYNVEPDYGFRDLNLKYSGSGRRSNYYVSLYGGKDHFSYSFEEETQNRITELDFSEHNTQAGGTAFYGFNWKEKNTGNLTVSFSSLQTDRAEIGMIERQSGWQNHVEIDEQSRTAIYEVNSRIDNKFVLSENQFIEAGLGLLHYQTGTREGTSQNLAPVENAGLELPYVYLQDNVTLFSMLLLKPGLRMDIHSITGKVYLQPRLSLMYRLNDYFRVNAAAGMYNQFVAKNIILDAAGNYTLDWALCDGSSVKVLNSQGYAMGFSFHKNDFVASIEGFLKYTGGLTRFLQTTDGTLSYEGVGRTKGLDLFVKKDFRNQTFWISYTLSKTEEKFPYFPTSEYLPAMHDQRHELKVAGLTKIKSFHFSANYVFGSGFPDPAQLPEVVDYMQIYSRLDAAVIYRFSKRKIHVDGGISVLNILNHENIRYSNTTRIPADETDVINLYTGAVPLTPALFLNIYY